MFHADGQTYVTKLIVAFHNFRNALQKALIGTLSTKTRTPNLGRGGWRAPHLGDHMMRQELSQWGQARTWDPAFGTSQHGKATLCHRRWNQANLAAHWWHTVRLACWPPFLVSPSRNVSLLKDIKLFYPTDNYTHRLPQNGAQKNSAFPPLSYLFCVGLRAIVQNWADGRCS